MRLLKRKYFITAVTGVMLSAVIQFGILSVMKNAKTIEQTVVLFYADLILVMIVDSFKKKQK